MERGNEKGDPLEGSGRAGYYLWLSWAAKKKNLSSLLTQFVSPFYLGVAHSSLKILLRLLGQIATFLPHDQL